jgi:hypothetical protein
MFSLWYGYNALICYGFVPQKDFVMYQDGLEKGCNRASLKLLAKRKDSKPLTSPEQARVQGYELMLTDLQAAQQDQARSKIEFLELHEVVDTERCTAEGVNLQLLFMPKPRKGSPFSTKPDQVLPPKKKLRHKLQDNGGVDEAQKTCEATRSSEKLGADNCAKDSTREEMKTKWHHPLCKFTSGHSTFDGKCKYSGNARLNNRHSETLMVDIVWLCEVLLGLEESCSKQIFKFFWQLVDEI